MQGASEDVRYEGTTTMGGWVRFSDVKRWIEKNKGTVSEGKSDDYHGIRTTKYEVSRRVGGDRDNNGGEVRTLQIVSVTSNTWDGQHLPAGTEQFGQTVEVVQRATVAKYAVTLVLDPKEVLGRDFASEFPKEAAELDTQEAIEQENRRQTDPRRSIGGLPSGEWPDPDVEGPGEGEVR
jgi:hypothetical protein